MFRVKVPATSANICCGLDTFGMAVTLYNTFYFSESEEFIYDGKKEDIETTNNLVLKSYLIACEYLGVRPLGVDVSGRFDVPSARGLGSSATCVVAGIIAAYRRHDVKIVLKDVFNIAATIEEHPDNVAPCIFGGMVLSYLTDTGFRYYKIHPDRKYRICAFIPQFKLHTDKSRGVLPDYYSRADAVFNIQRASLLPLSIERGNTSFVRDALDDRLHERYRKELIDGYDDVIEITKKHGFVGTYLSGAGPTIMGLYEGSLDSDAVIRDLKKMKYSYRLRHLRIDTRGVQF